MPFSHYYEFIKTPIFLFSFWGIIFLFCLRFYLKTPHLFKPFFTLCVVSFFLLMPVINMYFMVIHLNENNRLGYFFSSMIFPILVIALFRLNKFIYIPILILFIVFNLFYTTKQAKDARIAGHIFTHCIKTFPAITNKKTYLINLPNNYKGYYLFRSLWRIESALFFFNHKKYNFIEIASINMLHETDTIYYQFEGDTILYMNHQIPSVYFMKDAFGAYSRKEPTFTLETEPWLMQCHIHFTPPRQSSDEFILFKKDSFYLVP